MNDQAIRAARTKFLARMTEFQSFREPGERYRSEEDEYKRAAITEVRTRLAPYVEDEQPFASDEEARKLANELFDLTNFLNWRDCARLDSEVLADEGSWVQFMTQTVECLRGSAAGDWQQPFKELLRFLADRKCPANLSKTASTYFLFLWDPKHHFFIKPSRFDRFLRKIDHPPLGSGVPLTVEAYQGVLATLNEVRETLEDWQPRDYVDLHSFAWVASSKDDDKGKRVESSSPDSELPKTSLWPPKNENAIPIMSRL